MFKQELTAWRIHQAEKDEEHHALLVSRLPLSLFLWTCQCWRFPGLNPPRAPLLSIISLWSHPAPGLLRISYVPLAPKFYLQSWPLLELHTDITNCTLNLFTWISSGHLPFDMCKMKLFISLLEQLSMSFLFQFMNSTQLVAQNKSESSFIIIFPPFYIHSVSNSCK